MPDVRAPSSVRMQLLYSEVKQEIKMQFLQGNIKNHVVCQYRECSLQLSTEENFFFLIHGYYIL